MPPQAISASFWRGGTSRGLLFRAEHVAPYSPAIRDRIILTALGSPDPAGRQISGLGGGVSSLSKAAIIGLPGEAAEVQKEFGALPGVEWADDGMRDGQAWDVVYRFAQVGVREPILDWTASCGNMFTAVSIAALSIPLLPYTTIFTRARSLPRSEQDPDAPIMFPLSILSASNGAVMRARVPIDPLTLQVWEPPAGQGVEIAGVPGRDEPGVMVEMPLDAASGQGGLVTGNARDVVRLGDGTEVVVSIVTSGLPNIFVPVSSLLEAARTFFADKTTPPTLTADMLALPASTLSSDSALCQFLEQIRVTAAQQFNIPLSLASPKITPVGPMPESGYATTSGTSVSYGDADLLVRAISSGDWHATIPGTTLGALNIGLGTQGTVIHEVVESRSEGQQSRNTDDEVVTVRAGHAAGVAESSVRFGEDGKPDAVVMVRTAREILRGEVLVPERIFSE